MKLAFLVVVVFEAKEIAILLLHGLIGHGAKAHRFGILSLGHLYALLRVRMREGVDQLGIEISGSYAVESTLFVLVVIRSLFAGLKWRVRLLKHPQLLVLAALSV